MRNRSITGAYLYVYLDGIVLKRSWAGEVRNVSVLVSVGISANGHRQIPGVTEGAKEDKAGWSGFFKHLKERGLNGVQLIISDACIGLVESVGDSYPDALWQRCTVHFYRNIFSVVPKVKMKEVTIMLKAIHAFEDLQAAHEKAESVEAKLRKMRLHQAADKLKEGIAETLSYYSFPRQHWRRIRTNNPLERIMREIRRRTNVVGAFSDGNSALMLVAARLRRIAGTKWSSKRYLNMQLLREHEEERQFEAA